MEEPCKHYTKQKKPDSKATYYDSIYMKCPEFKNPETQSRLVVVRGREGEGMVRDCLMGTALLFGVDKNGLQLESGWWWLHNNVNVLLSQ